MIIKTHSMNNNATAVYVCPVLRKDTDGGQQETRNNHSLISYNTVLIASTDTSSCCEQNLTPPRDECVCAGNSLQLNCTAVGIGTTVWTIDDQQCTRAIELPHLEFHGGVTKRCSEALDAPTGRSVSVIDETECYTSQLTIMVTSDLNGTSVGCEHDSGANVECIGVYPIMLTSGIKGLSMPCISFSIQS